MSGPALAAEGLSVAFGGLTALAGVSLAAAPGEILAVIGPNGAGKTTLFNLVSGLHRPDAGRIRLHGRDVTGLPPHRLAARGLGRTFQNLQLFHRMSAIENVLVGGHLKARHGGLLRHLAGPPGWRAAEAESRAAAMALLERVGLGPEADRPAGALPYGAAKRLEIARALAGRPGVLLLDEPAAGCNPVETRELERLIRGIARADGVAVVLVEHDMGLVMRLADRLHVLHHGRTLAEGGPAQVRADPAVIEAYLGPGLPAPATAHG